MTDFCALDVETANYNYASICAIGIVRFNSSGEIIDEFESLCYQEYFADFNTQLHGIGEKDVVSAPKFPELIGRIAEFIGDNPIVAHSPFDKSAINQAIDAHGCNYPNFVWYDSCQLARKIWPRLENHRLSILCEYLDIPLNHHDALSDAKAAGIIICIAMEKTGQSFEELFQ